MSEPEIQQCKKQKHNLHDKEISEKNPEEDRIRRERPEAVPASVPYERKEKAMTEKHLAIASVPLQNWEEPYPEEEAFAHGTVFRELDKPFFASSMLMEKKADQGMQGVLTGKSPMELEQEQLLAEIMQTGFFLDDLTLYLDTHELEEQVIVLYKEKQAKLAGLKQQFAQRFYPLNRGEICECEASGKFCWQQGPMPWEGACI